MATEFLRQVGLHLWPLVALDGSYLALNQYFQGGIYRGIDMAAYSRKKTFLLCLSCWLASAIYMAGHLQSSMNSATLEGLWLGSMVYIVFNVTALFIDKQWTMQMALLDTLWGSLLFMLAKSFAYGLS